MQQQQQSESTGSTSATKRWWQEEQSTPQTGATSQPIIQTVAESVTERDIGEELEEEARQRALTTEPVTVIPLVTEIQRRVFRISLWILVPLALFLTLVAFFGGTSAISSYFFAGMIWTEVIVFLVLLKKASGRASTNEVRLSPRGIHIVVGPTDYGLIPWDKVAEIRPYRLLTQPYVGIDLHDAIAYSERCSPSVAKVLRFSEPINRFLRRCGMFCPTLAIAQQALPMTAEEFMALVTAARCTNNAGD